MVLRILTAAGLFALSLSAATPAHALVDVPAKAIWSVTDVNSMQFCDGCDVDNISPTTRRANYARVIADTVGLGARAIFVHAVTGAATGTRVGEFFQELVAYRDANPDVDVCGALLYADYGAAHPNDQIDSQWQIAYTDSGSGAAYCSIAGKPVVATLEDRPDFACQFSKYNNIFTNRISKLSGGGDGFHWVAAFGETAEFADWQANCQGRLLPAVVSSYLEMANDNPAAGAAATSRASAMGGGGRYILGIPTASGTNCGTFCSDGTDSAAYVNRGFGGFARTLAAWRSGIDNLAYTYGPGGRVTRDEFVSSAYKCGADDLTPYATGVCSAPGASTFSRVPGVTEPSDVVAGNKCDGIAPPQAAIDAGLTALEFCDDFSTPSIDMTDAMDLGGNYKWTRKLPFGYAASPPSDFTFANGTMRLDTTEGGPQFDIITARKMPDNTIKGYYIDRKAKGFYVYIRWKFDKEEARSSGFQAWWSMDGCHLFAGGTYPDGETASCPNGIYLEPDHFELIAERGVNREQYTLHFHDEDLQGTAKKKIGLCRGSVPDVIDRTEWHTHGALYIPGEKNVYYQNGAVRFTRTNASNCTVRDPDFAWDGKAALPLSMLGDGRYPLHLGTGLDNAIVVDTVAVWGHPDEVE